MLFWLPLIAFKLIMLTICMLSALEWGQLSGIPDSKRILLSIACGLLITIMTFIIPIYWPLLMVFIENYILWLALVWWLIALLLILSYPRTAVFWQKSNLLRLIFGLLTIIPFFWGMISLRYSNHNDNSVFGSWISLYLMFLVWSADSSAYIFGRALGRHKLAPKISPGKTWEGLISGLLISTIIAWLFNYYVSLNVAPFKLIICSIVAVFFSIVGDLTESMFKREAGIKDSGCIIPGHGGMLDRIDSLTAAVPVFACLMLQVFHVI